MWIIILIKHCLLNVEIEEGESRIHDTKHEYSTQDLLYRQKQN
jgi:hypothetical protein